MITDVVRHGDVSFPQDEFAGCSDAATRTRFNQRSFSVLKRTWRDEMQRRSSNARDTTDLACGIHVNPTVQEDADDWEESTGSSQR